MIFKGGTDVRGIQTAAASKRYVRALAKLRQILESIPAFASRPPGSTS